MINPEPRLFCLNSLWGVSPKKRSKKSSPPKYRPRGDPSNGDRTPPPRIILVVLMFTTDGLSLSAKSANDNGACEGEAVETAEASCTSGTGDDLKKEERSTSTAETIKKPIKKAMRNMTKVFRPLFSVFIFLLQ